MSNSQPPRAQGRLYRRRVAARRKKRGLPVSQLGLFLLSHSHATFPCLRLPMDGQTYDAGHVLALHVVMSQTAPPLMGCAVWTLLLPFSPGLSLHVELLGARDTNRRYTVSRWDRLLIFGACNLGALACFVICFALFPVMSLAKPRKLVVL
jgi:hypothetical protein